MPYRQRIGSFAVSCYGVVLGIGRVDHVPDAQLYVDTDVEPLVVSEISTAGLSWSFAKDVRGEPCSMCALCIPCCGMRGAGGQRTLYLSCVRKLFGDTDGMLQPNAIQNMAQDRSEWRKYVIACCAAER